MRIPYLPLVLAASLVSCRAYHAPASTTTSRLAEPAADGTSIWAEAPTQPAGVSAEDRSPSTDLEVADDIVLAIHGGAGTIRRSRMTPELEEAYRAKLKEALETGYGVLLRGGSSLDAVEATIKPLEDSHLFNSGRGAVLNDEGEVEMDASIMVGGSRMAGAVASVRTTRHPITLARKVMEESEHVLLAGAGADRFSREQGLEQMDPSWFVTPHRLRQLEILRAKDEGRTAALDASAVLPLPLGNDELARQAKFGTVGCVALDSDGHLAAGTSTGGRARKAWGRVGDSPIVGAGTWADDATCAVSCTGHGEFFIRRAVAHQIHARMLYAGAGIEGAARATILDDLPRPDGSGEGGSGGCVALDSGGRMVAPFTTLGMYRGWVDSEGNVTVRIHGDERR